MSMSPFDQPGQSVAHQVNLSTTAPQPWLEPGSHVAQAAGCVCPPLDNAVRSGTGSFVIMSNCPVHCPTLNPRDA